MDVIKRVRIDVMQETANKQVPWQASSLTGNFYFAKKNFGAPKPHYQEPEAQNFPPEIKISFDDILQSTEKKRKEEKAWKRWQAARNSEYETVRKIDRDQYATAEQKAKAWKRFFAAVSQNNPYSSVDDEMRTYSGTRISHWHSLKSEGKNADYASVTMKNFVIDEMRLTALTDEAERKTSVTLIIDSNERGAKVYIDKQKNSFLVIPYMSWIYRGNTPFEAIDLQPGEHEIKVTKQGYHDYTRTIHLDPGDNRKINIAFTERGGPGSAGAEAGGGSGGGAGRGVGGTAGDGADL